MSTTPEASLGYHDRMALAADSLAIVLTNDGLETAIERAQVVAENFDHDYKFLLGQASLKLFQSGDPELWEPGFALLAWEAEHFPDTEDANGLAYNAKYDARREEAGMREFAKRCFEISLAHFRFAAQAEGFVPTVKFLEDFNAVTARIEEEGYPELYVAAITEFAPLTIQVAENYQSPESEGMDYDKQAVDETLEHVYVALRKKDPELAKKAAGLITDPAYTMLLESFRSDGAFTDALLASEFTSAKEILAASDHLIQNLWPKMLQKLTANEEGAEQWANQSLDVILEARPGYFSDKEYADLFYGRPVGHILGLLDRRDIIDSMLNEGVDMHMTGQIAAGAAEGLGARKNQDGFNHLLGQINHYDPKIIEIIKQLFEEFRQNPQSRS